MFTLKSRIFFYALLLAINSIWAQGSLAETVTCRSLFQVTNSQSYTKKEAFKSEPVLSIESDLMNSVRELERITKEYHSLPAIPSSYQYNQYENFPRVKWVKNNKADIQFGYYSKIYELENEAARVRKTDQLKASNLYLELAKLYIIGQDSRSAILSSLRAGRGDIADWIANTLQYPLPELYDYHTPRNKLSDYLEGLRKNSGFTRLELSQIRERAQDYHWDELEVQARRLKRSSNPIDQNEGLKLYQKLAEDYLSHLMYQEAIWSFREAQNFNRANEIQKYLVNVLLNNPLIRTDLEVGGVTNSKIYELAPGIRAIVKFKSGPLKGNQKPSNEVLAYEISELLGMNNISTTVMRRIGLRQASLQVLVKRPSGKAKWISESKDEIKKNNSNMDVFDYLIANQDRHNDMGAHNQFSRYGSNQVLIDHGISFRPYLIIRHIPVLKKLNQNIDVINHEYRNLKKQLPDLEFIKALESLDEPEQNKKLRALFTGGSLSVNYQIFEYRRKEVLNEIKRLSSPN